MRKPPSEESWQGETPLLTQLQSEYPFQRSVTASGLTKQPPQKDKLLIFVKQAGSLEHVIIC